MLHTKNSLADESVCLLSGGPARDLHNPALGKGKTEKKEKSSGECHEFFVSCLKDEDCVKSLKLEKSGLLVHTGDMSDSHSAQLTDFTVPVDPSLIGHLASVDVKHQEKKMPVVVAMGEAVIRK